MRIIGIIHRKFSQIRGRSPKKLAISMYDRIVQEKLDEFSSKGSNPISWYPGHIAKAERELAEYLKKVDVVIEVRDARIPLSTTHPTVPQWVGGKPLIVAVSRLDQVSPHALKEWKNYYDKYPVHINNPNTHVFFIDGKAGTGVIPLKECALDLAKIVNERRKRHGIQPRAVRAAIIGFPNVGKSALINRLLGKKMARSRNRPGVTRSMQWVRLGNKKGSNETQNAENTLELLDSPGIIPAKAIEQENAIKLAICNDIGEASYDRVTVAGFLVDMLNRLYYRKGLYYVNMNKIEKRYNIPFQDMTGDEVLYEIGKNSCQGNLISAADKLLADYRKGYLGLTSLEAPIPLPIKKKTIINKKKTSKESERDTMGEFESESDMLNGTTAVMETVTVTETRSDDYNESINLNVNLDPGKGKYDDW
jgi:ribosome biogenesis GTPase A